MANVKQILETKGHDDIWSIGPNDWVIDALKLMTEKNAGALIVMKMDKIVGIISERDYARKVDLAGKSAAQTQVREIMTRNVVCINAHHSIENCMGLMTQKRIRHLPVCKDKAVIGMISIGDVIKSLLSEQEFMIEQLESYITGT